MKVSEKWTEQKNGVNDIPEYGKRGLKWNLPGAVAGFIFFVLLMSWFFENKSQTKMKLKVSVKNTEQKKCGNTHL